MNIEVFERNGQWVTTSLNIAEVFGKSHTNVLRDIRNIIDKWEELGLINFEQSSYFIESQYINEQGKSQPMYYLTKKGTARLVMGFTGLNAERFKIGYIETFDAMEQYVLDTKEHLIRLQEENMALKDGIIASLESENKALIERANSILESANYFKVRNYFEAQGVKLTVDECKSIGLKATMYCKHKAIPIKPEFTSLGKTNTYPSNVLQMLHKQYVISTYNTLNLFN